MALTCRSAEFAAAAEFASFGFQGLALGFIGGLADRFRDLVGLPIALFEPGLLRFAAVFEHHEPIDVDVDAPVRAVLFDQVDVLDDEFAIEHGESSG